MKKCVIVENSFKKESLPLGSSIKEFLTGKNIEANEFTYDGKNVSDKDLAAMIKDADFVITLGGDGTVLFASRVCAPLSIPVFPVNLGEFGFIAGIQKNEWQQELSLFIEGKAQTQKRSLVSAEVVRNGKSIFTCSGMNDIVISSSTSVKIVNIDVDYNKAPLGHFKADGIVFATATGSTAYSAAAGGPIVDPSLNVIVLTPVNSFSLSARPLVLNPENDICVTILPSRASLELTCDGQIPFALEEDDKIKISVSKDRATLVCSTQLKFYAALRSKLNWSGGPLA